MLVLLSVGLSAVASPALSVQVEWATPEAVGKTANYTYSDLAGAGDYLVATYHDWNFESPNGRIIARRFAEGRWLDRTRVGSGCCSKAAPGGVWQPPVRVGRGSPSVETDTVIGPGGKVTVCMARSKGLFVRSRRLNGSWGATHQLRAWKSAPGGMSLVKALDGSPTVVAWWRRDSVRAVRHTRGGWSAAMSLGQPIAMEPEEEPWDITVDRAATVVVAWGRADGEVMATTWPSDQGEPAPAVVVAQRPAADQERAVHVAANPDGDAVIGFPSRSHRDALTASYRPAGGSWGSAQPVSMTSDPVSAFNVALLDDGSAHATWTEYDFHDSASGATVMTSSRPR